jgi:hypothetical protein
MARPARPGVSLLSRSVGYHPQRLRMFPPIDCGVPPPTLGVLPRPSCRPRESGHSERTMMAVDRDGVRQWAGGHGVVQQIV